MENDGAPETEVPHVEDTADMQDNSQPKGVGGPKAKRKWTKVNTADYYNPTPYAAAKGRGMGKSGGKSGGKGGMDGDVGHHKGKSKGAAYHADHDVPIKPQDDDKQLSSMEGTSAGAGDTDQVHSKGGMNKKKQGGKGREGKGKGGKALGQRKGKARGGPMPPEVPETAPEAEGPRPRPAAPAKGTGQQGMGGVSMAVSPYSYGVPYSYGAVPCAYGAAVPAMYALPYYVMQAPTQLNTGSTPYMPGAAQQPSAQPSAVDRQQLKQNVQAQIEYYFGQENLIKDWYLRSSLMNEEGWVPLQLLAGFRRVQSMTTDLSIIQEAVASSQMLELDPQGALLRLKENWEEWIVPNRGAPNAGVQGSSQNAKT